MKTYVIVTPFFPSDSSFRGCFVFDQVEAIIRSRKYDQVLVFKSGGRGAEDYVYKGIHVYCFPQWNLPSLILNGVFNNLNSRAFLRVFKRSELAIDEVSVVHCHVSNSVACGLALKGLNPKILCVLQHHDPDPFTVRNGKFAGVTWNARYRARKNIHLFNRIDLHVSVSSRVEENLLCFPHASRRDMYQDYLNKLVNLRGLSSIQPKATYVLNNGVDVSQFYSVGVAPIGPKGFHIGCIANFVDWKQQLILIKAVECLVRVHGQLDVALTLVGSGPTWGECQDYVEEQGLSEHVVFERERAHSKLLDFYNSLDLFVLPSVFEGFGCVFLEAYACGVPFMSCECQGVEDCFDPVERAKWLFPAGDYQQLAKMVIGFRTHQYKQVLSMSHCIDDLVSGYLQKVEELLELRD